MAFQKQFVNVREERQAPENCDLRTQPLHLRSDFRAFVAQPCPHVVCAAHTDTELPEQTTAWFWEVLGTMDFIIALLSCDNNAVCALLTSNENC